MLGFGALGQFALGQASAAIGASADTHDGPPPSFLNWARKEKQRIFSKLRTEKEAREKLVEVARVVEAQMPETERTVVRELMPIVNAPSIDMRALMGKTAEILQLLVLFERFQQEQQVLLLLLED